MRLVVAVTAVVLGGGGVAASWAMSRPATGAAAPPPVDHQLCYSASGTHFKIPSGVKLFDQFSPKGFVPKISSTLMEHCNPVKKILPSGRIFPITNPNAHVACFPITPQSPQPTPKVVVTNQFGKATLVPSQPNLLCAPSWKSLTGPPKKTPNTPPGLNHFTCYPVKVASGAYKPPSLMLQDEFAKKPVAAKVSPVPVELCLPTRKVVGTHVFKIINPAIHLLVFPVSSTPIVPKVWDENQFGTSVVNIRATNALAVPSTKTIVAAPPPVDHQLCYSASGTHFKVPRGVRLVDQFSRNGFVPKISSTLSVHCNPVQKTLPTGRVFPITNPNAHLGCFSITPPSTQPTPRVTVTNQFGSALLVPGQPNLLCAPSWKSLTGPPGKKPTTPPGLNHFTCYPVKVASGKYSPPSVVLQDEFARKGVKAKVNPVPAELCLPTEKIVGKRVFNIINPAMHLLMFPVSTTPIIPKVWDENQFGTSPVHIRATQWLGVPSTKKIG